VQLVGAKCARGRLRIDLVRREVRGDFSHVPVTAVTAIRIAANITTTERTASSARG
jgi:hypothetical protein